MRFLIFVLAIFLAGKSVAQQVNLSLSVDTNGNYHGCVKGTSKGILYLEHFRWNRWVRMDSVQISRDTCIDRSIRLHSDENQLRLSAISRGDSVHYSSIVKVKRRPLPPRDRVCGPTGKIELPEVTYWEIYDQYGRKIASGESKEISMADFPQGGYFLNYDNRTMEFFVNKDR